MPAQVILVEAQPARAADGVAETIRLAGGGALVPYAYGGQTDWRAGVVGLPTLIASLEYEGGEFPAGSVPAAAAIEWAPSNKALLSATASYVWADAPITVRIGNEGAALPPVRISGKVLDAKASGGKLTIALADPATSLKKPLLTTRFAGTGGLEGPAEWDGQIRRRVWGRIWNLSGDPIDAANNIYCFADPLRPLQAFDAVRDKGAPAAALTVLAWQGSTAATFAALQAASAPAGGGVACPSIACVKWWTQPAGELCADLRGEVGTGYVETTAAIAQRLVEAIGGPAFTAGTVAAAAAARPAPVGWVAKDDTSTVAAMLDELLGNSSLLWLLDDNGAITIRPWTWGASVASATSQDVSRVQVLRPLATRKLGYKRNETPMQRGDLAAIVLSSEVAYLDGSSLESLKPAEGGATHGAILGEDLRLTDGNIPSQSQVITAEGTALAIVGQGSLATQNNVHLGNQVTGLLPVTNAAPDLRNNAITISLDGILNGAGGGQVTIGGLGFTGDLNATHGAVVGSNIRNDLGEVVPATELLNSLNPALNYVGVFTTAPTEATLGSAWKQNAVYKNSANGKSYVLTGTPLAWQVYLEDGQLFQLTVESSNGTTFRVGQSVTTLLKARLFKNGAEVTDVTPTGWFRWRRVSAIPMSPPNDDASWNAAYSTGYRQVAVSVDDVAARATFFCDILSPS